jgi:hypothetical protein
VAFWTALRTFPRFHVITNSRSASWVNNAEAAPSDKPQTDVGSCADTATQDTLRRHRELSERSKTMNAKLIGVFVAATLFGSSPALAEWGRDPGRTDRAADRAAMDRQAFDRAVQERHQAERTREVRERADRDRATREQAAREQAAREQAAREIQAKMDAASRAHAADVRAKEVAAQEAKTHVGKEVPALGVDVNIHGPPTPEVPGHVIKNPGVQVDVTKHF